MQNDTISRGYMLEQVVEKEFDWRTPYATGYNDAVRVMREKVWSAPALDVAPVVHARWVNGKCSRCKTAVLAFSHKENDGFGAVTVGNGDYCSNCGARMDGDTDE